MHISVIDRIGKCRHMTLSVVLLEMGEGDNYLFDAVHSSNGNASARVRAQRRSPLEQLLLCSTL